jgi:hypothetical protein
MKILLICSKAFYGELNEYKFKLEKLGHEIFLPNCHDCPETESKFRGTPEHHVFKAKMFRQSEETIKNMDAVLVLNFNKNGQENYIGGATFLEIYDAFRMNKKIYFVNDIPNNMLKDELIGFNPTIVGNDLVKIK